MRSTFFTGVFALLDADGIYPVRNCAAERRGAAEVVQYTAAVLLVSKTERAEVCTSARQDSEALKVYTGLPSSTASEIAEVYTAIPREADVQKYSTFAPLVTERSVLEVEVTEAHTSAALE